MNPNLTIQNLTTIERRGDRFHLIFKTGIEQRMDRTRFRHHGPRKWRYALEVRPVHERMEVSHQFVRWLKRFLDNTGTEFIYPADAYSDDFDKNNWSITIKK